MPAILTPFSNPDFKKLYLLNICEFFATTLSRLSALQWLYEDTGSGRALGALRSSLSSVSPIFASLRP